MKIRVARKIWNVEHHGHTNYRWFKSNSRGTECSPWRVSTRSKALKRLKLNNFEEVA